MSIHTFPTPHSTYNFLTEGLAVRKQSWICQFWHIFNGFINNIPFIGLFLHWLIQHWSGTKSRTWKCTRLLTYIIWKDISSCFNSNNVWVVIEDFESHRTVILVCKKTQNDNNKNYCQILTITCQWMQINQLTLSILVKIQFYKFFDL